MDYYCYCCCDWLSHLNFAAAAAVVVVVAVVAVRVAVDDDVELVAEES